MGIVSGTKSAAIDRLGIVASIGCAIHCMVAPLLLVFAPLVGAWWVDPITHLIIAALVLPMAAVGLGSGVRRHGRKWIAITGLVGGSLILGGAVLPLASDSKAAGQPCTECCPTVTVNEETGAWTWRFPLASVVTLVGGAALVTAHAGNLRCCSRC